MDSTLKKFIAQSHPQRQMTLDGTAYLSGESEFWLFASYVFAA
jgi:hypothetical protein